MLIHYKEKNGILHYNGYRIYGINAGPPCDLPKNIYKQLKDIVVFATYREGFFRTKFNKKVSPIAFTYPEIDYLSRSIANKLLRELGYVYNSHDAMKGALKCLLDQ